jgi:hypothetical protein
MNLSLGSPSNRTNAPTSGPRERRAPTWPRSLTAVVRLGKRVQNQAIEPKNAVNDRVYRTRRPGIFPGYILVVFIHSPNSPPIHASVKTDPHVGRNSAAASSRCRPEVAT